MTGQPHTQATPIGINSSPRGFRLGLILHDSHRLGLILHAFHRLGLVLQGFRCLGLILHGFHRFHHPRAIRRLVLHLLGPLAPRLHRLHHLHGFHEVRILQVELHVVGVNRLAGLRRTEEPPFTDQVGSA